MVQAIPYEIRERIINGIHFVNAVEEMRLPYIETAVLIHGLRSENYVELISGS